MEPERDTEDFLTPAEVAELFKVSRVTIWDWARKGTIPSFRSPTGRYRFRRSELEPFLPPEPTEAAS